MKRLALKILAVLALLWPAVALASQPAGPPIVLGGTVSLSGRFSTPSAMIQSGLKLWAGQINRGGGLLGRPVRLLLYDDKSDTNLTTELYRRLIVEDKVDLLVAPYGTRLTSAAAAVADGHHMVLMAVAAASETLWERGYRYLFGVYATARRYYIGLPDLMARHGMKSLVVLFTEDDFNASAAAGAVHWARRFGVTVLLARGLGEDGSGLARGLEEARVLQPDGLILSTYIRLGYESLEIMKTMGWRPRVLAMSITPALPDFGVRVGEESEDVIAPSQWEPSARLPFPGTRRFISDFKEFSGVTPSYQAAATYTAMTILAQAVRRTGSLEQDRIREYIQALDTVTLLGRFKVDATGRQIGHNPLLIQWQGGVKEIIYPPKMQTATPKF